MASSWADITWSGTLLESETGARRWVATGHLLDDAGAIVCAGRAMLWRADADGTGARWGGRLVCETMFVVAGEFGLRLDGFVGPVNLTPDGVSIDSAGAHSVYGFDGVGEAPPFGAGGADALERA